MPPCRRWGMGYKRVKVDCGCVCCEDKLERKYSSGPYDVHLLDAALAAEGSFLEGFLTPCQGSNWLPAKGHPCLLRQDKNSPPVQRMPAPSAPALQCSTALPGKWPPRRSSLAPPNSSFSSPADRSWRQHRCQPVKGHITMLPCHAWQPAMPKQHPWVPQLLMAHQQETDPAHC